MASYETFSTQNLYQAAYCMTCGFKIVGTEREGNRVSVIFQGNGIKAKALNFYNGEKVEAKAVFDAYRTIKDMVFQKR